MKLYTKEQVLEIAKAAFESGLKRKSFLLNIDSLTPIELPSDEEIEEYSIKWFMTANKHEIIFDLGWMKIFKAGAKMVIDKIQGGNK